MYAGKNTIWISADRASYIFYDRGNLTLNLVVDDVTIMTWLATGVAAPRNIHTGGVGVTQTTDGNDTTPVITETYIAEVLVNQAVTVTGVAVFNGSAVGTDKTVAIIYDSTGAVVANTALAGTTAVGTDTYQRVPLTATILLKPGTYYVGLQVNGTTYRAQTHIAGNFGASKKTGETFGTPTAITPPTTFTTAVGVIASLY